MSSLFSLQPLCVKHGPPLSVDQQLHWILEQKVLHFAAHLCSHSNILQYCNDVLCVVLEHSLGTWRLLLLEIKEWIRYNGEKFIHLGCFCHERHHCYTNDNVPKIPHKACSKQQDNNWESRNEKQIVPKSLWHRSQTKLGTSFWNQQNFMAFSSLLRQW
jgi:hypothetical protein